MLWMIIVSPSQFLLGERSYKISFSFVFSLVFNVISAGKLIGRINILLSIMSLGMRSALQNSQKEYLLSPTGRVRNDLALSVQNILPALQGILHRPLKSISKQAKGVKFQLRCKVLLEKFSFETDHVKLTAETHRNSHFDSFESGFLSFEQISTRYVGQVRCIHSSRFGVHGQGGEGVQFEC